MSAVPVPDLEPGFASGEPGGFAVLLPAAGKSLRYSEGGRGSKLAERIGGRSVLGHSAAAFLCRADVAQVVIATGDEAGARALLGELAGDGRVKFTIGGANRAQSVLHALMAVRPGVEFVAVHDAARPCVSQGLIDRVFEAARVHGAAGPAMAVTLTIKEAKGPLPAEIVRTVPRKSLWAMQTPQAMRTAELSRAYLGRSQALEEVTDDLQMLELAGRPGVLVEGEEGNLKITHPGDLEVAMRIMAARS